MSRKTFWISFSVMIAIIGALIYLNIWEDAREEACDISFPMVNQNITWQGAGYNGIYEK